jgi:hypothetical protein
MGRLTIAVLRLVPTAITPHIRLLLLLLLVSSTVEHLIEEAELRGRCEGPQTKKEEKLEHDCYTRLCAQRSKVVARSKDCDNVVMVLLMWSFHLAAHDWPALPSQTCKDTAPRRKISVVRKNSHLEIHEALQHARTAANAHYPPPLLTLKHRRHASHVHRRPRGSVQAHLHPAEGHRRKGLQERAPGPLLARRQVQQAPRYHQEALRTSSDTAE